MICVNGNMLKCRIFIFRNFISETFLYFESVCRCNNAFSLFSFNVKPISISEYNNLLPIKQFYPFHLLTLSVCASRIIPCT